MPSRPMFTTPERSQITPPSAPKTSGVAKRSIAAASADQTMTCSRLPVPTSSTATAPTPPTTPATTAPQPSRFWPSRRSHAPSPIATSARITEEERRAHQQRRQRDPPGEDADGDAAPARPGRALDAAEVEPPRVAVAAVTSRPPPARLLIRPRASRAQPVERRHDHGRRDQQDDEAHDDQRQVRRELGREDLRVEVAHRRAVVQRAEQQRAEEHAGRRVAPQQRDRDADEARADEAGVLDVVGGDANCQPSTSMAPASPAKPPHHSITFTQVRPAWMPPYSAASGLKPTARAS